MHAVDADEAGASVWGGRSALPDGDGIAAGLGPVGSGHLVAGLVTQVIQVCHGERGEPCIAGIAIDGIGALHQTLGGGAGQGVMQGIGLCEQLHVSGGEFAGEAHRRGAIALGELLPLEAPAYQPPELGSRVAGGARHMEHQHTLLGLAKLWISKAPKHRGDKAVALKVVADGLEFDFKGSCQKGA